MSITVRVSTARCSAARTHDAHNAHNVMQQYTRTAQRSRAPLAPRRALSRPSSTTVVAWARRFTVETVFPRVASRASMLYLAARAHNRAAVCLRTARIAALWESGPTGHPRKYNSYHKTSGPGDRFTRHVMNSIFDAKAAIDDAALVLAEHAVRPPSAQNILHIKHYIMRTLCI